MKKIILIIFLFFSSNVFASDYIASDNSFTFSFWFDPIDNGVYTYQTSFVTIGSPGTKGLIVIERDVSGRPDCFSFAFYASAAQAAYNFCFEPGRQYMMTISVGLYIDGNKNVILYIDAVKQTPVFFRGSGSVTYIEGNVILSDKINPDSFIYSPDVLTSEQIKNLYDFGEPGTINYQVNLLFWEVIRHFRSFF